MAVTILDAIQKGFSNTSQTHTQSLTLTAGSDRVVVVGALLNHASSRVFTSATYGGNAMTQIDTIIEVGQYLRASLYYIKEADLPANGANNIVVTADIAVSDIGCFGLTLQDVNQTALAEDSATEQGASTSTSSVNLTVTGGALQLNMLAHRADTGTLTWGAGQTEKWDADIGGTRAGASTQTGASAGTEAIAWTSSIAHRFAHVAASFTAATTVNPSPGVMNITGVNPTVVHTATPGATSVAITGVAPTVVHSPQPAPGVLTITGNSVVLKFIRMLLAKAKTTTFYAVAKRTTTKAKKKTTAFFARKKR